MTSLTERSEVRVLYLGLHGVFSQTPLRSLLAEGADICGIVVPSPQMPMDNEEPIRRLQPESRVGELPLVNPYIDPSIVQMGWEAGIPVFQMLSATAPETLAEVRALQPDVACVACYNRVLPPDLLAIPRHGFLNLHPSLLPEYRGPHPVFWSLHQGEPRMGVTLHLMDQGVDTGAIIYQEVVVVGDGLSAAAIDERLASVGSRMLIEAIRRLAEGELTSRPQPAGGSYYSAPDTADFALDLQWTARHAFNFIRGTSDWGRIYALVVAGEQLALRTALSYEPASTQERPLERDGPVFRIQFSQGILIAK